MTYRMNATDLATARQQKRLAKRDARGKRLKFSPSINPLVRQVFQRVQDLDISLATLVAESGVGRTAIYNMRHEASPTIDSFEALANTVGLELVLRPKANPPGRPLPSKDAAARQALDVAGPPGHDAPMPPMGQRGGTQS